MARNKIDICDTFKEAARSWGLLEADDEWKNTLRDAAEVQSGRQMRELLVVMLFEGISDPKALFEQFKEPLSEDLRHRYDTSEEDGHGLALQ